MRYLAIGLFLLNLLLGFYFLNEGLFHYDSVLLAQAVEKTCATGVLQPASRGRYGSVIVNLLVYYPFFLLGQNADFALRFSGVLFQALSIAVLFLLLEELFKDQAIASFVALLFSFTPFYFIPNTYGKDHGLSMFVFLLSLYFLAKGLAKKSSVLIVVSSLLFALAVTIRESILIALPLYFFFYFHPRISRRPLRVALLKERLNVQGVAALVLPLGMLLGWVYFIYLRAEIHTYIFNTHYANTVNFMGLFSRFLPQAIKDLLASIPVLVFCLFPIGVFKMIRDKKIFLASFFLLWSLFIFYFGNQRGYCPRYLEIVILPVYVFAAYVLAFMYRRKKIIALCGLVYCLVYMVCAMYPLLVFRRHYNGEKQFALYVQGKTEPGAVIIAMDDSPFIEYYAKRRTILYPLGSWEETSRFIGKIVTYLNENTPVYLISSAYSYDPEGNFKKIFGENFSLELAGKKLAEDYHRPELKFQLYYEALFKVKHISTD